MTYIPPTTHRPDPLIPEKKGTPPPPVIPPEMRQVRSPGWRWVIAIAAVWAFAIAANVAYLRWVKS